METEYLQRFSGTIETKKEIDVIIEIIGIICIIVISWINREEAKKQQGKTIQSIEPDEENGNRNILGNIREEIIEEIYEAQEIEQEKRNNEMRYMKEEFEKKMKVNIGKLNGRSSMHFCKRPFTFLSRVTLR